MDCKTDCCNMWPDFWKGTFTHILHTVNQINIKLTCSTDDGFLFLKMFSDVVATITKILEKFTQCFKSYEASKFKTSVKFEKVLFRKNIWV